MSTIIINGDERDPTRNCTVDGYAAVKNLPVGFLSSLGLETVQNPHDPTLYAVRIPYADAAGEHFRNRYRVALVGPKEGKGKRFLFDSEGAGKGTLMYGLSRLGSSKASHAAHYLLLVEGESDCHASWHRGYRALGLPGASNFNSDRDDPHLDKEDEIYAVIEPGDGGTTMIKGLSRSRNRRKIKLIRLDPIKDLSDLHVVAGDEFDKKLAAAVEVAVALDAFLEQHPKLDLTIDKIDPAPPPGFRMDKFGNVESRQEGSTDPKPDAEQWSWLCSPIKCLGMARDEEGRGWARVFEIIDADGQRHVAVIKMELLAGRGDEVLRLFFHLGLRLKTSRTAREKFLALIGSWRTRGRVLLVRQLGWHGRAYVHPLGIFGDTDNERIELEPEAPISPRLKSAGKLSDWQNGVARLAVGNSRLILALSLPFTGPLLQLVGGESGGCHLVGMSSIGKTVLARCAGSVTGGGGSTGNVLPWRITSNGGEVTTASHNDGFMALDEIGQVEPHVIKQATYMLANGQGKLRADRSLLPRKPFEWHVVFLSTGEMTLEAKLSEAKLRLMAGEEVRFLNIPADAGAGMGAFEELHGFSDAGVFADHLREVSGHHYGTAFLEYLGHLTRDLEEAKATVEPLVAEFVLHHCPAGSSGQVRRVYARFALIAAAGELAARFGVLPWSAGVATDGVAKCAAAWLVDRGGVDQSEPQRGIEQVRRFIQVHESDRFCDFAAWSNKTPRRAGFVKTGKSERLFLFSDAGFEEACRGISPSIVAQALLEKGHLQPGENKRTKKMMRFPVLLGFDRPKPERFYVVSSTILQDAGDDDAIAAD